MKNFHYYSENQESLSKKPQDFTLFFREHKYIFTTDNGVFSKKYLDFGSHTLLENFEPNDLQFPILDVGCGYGPMGTIISTLYDKEVIMVDINERAIELANKNIIQNKASKAKAIKSNLYSALDLDSKFSSIVSNPPIRAGKKVVFEIYEKAKDFLVPGGELWIVIQKKQGAPSSMKELERIFGNVSVVAKQKGYYILKSFKETID